MTLTFQMTNKDFQQKTTISNGNSALRGYSLEGIITTAQGLAEYAIFTFTNANGTFTKELNNKFPLLIQSVQAESASGQVSITSEGLPIVPNQSSVELVIHPEIVLRTESRLEITTSEETKIRITTKRVALL